MKDLEEPFIAKVKEYVDHQGIGGREIRIEKEGYLDYCLDTRNMTIAIYNFINRIDIFKYPDTTKVYYGHSDNGLGYFVLEEELEYAQDKR